MTAPADGEILFLCHRIPFPPDRGDKIRSYNLLRKLAQIAPVHIGCFADDARDLSFTAELAEFSKTQMVLPRDNNRVLSGLRGLALRQPLLVATFDNSDLHRWVRRTIAERPIAAVVAYSAQMAHFVPPKLASDVRFLMDFVDLDSAKYAAYGSVKGGPMGWVNRREGKVLLDFEKAVASRADVTTFVSEAEAGLFRHASGLGRDKVRALENGVALGFFDPAADFARVPDEERGEGPLIVFTGQMDYQPNIQAVESFARRSLPRIRARHPDVRFAIVGRKPARQVQALQSIPGVIVTGAVADVRGWLAAADVVVAPLRIARGVQNKVLEAMAMGRPVVASADAAQGIDAAHGTDLMVAVDPSVEADMVADLLADPKRASALGFAARKRMVERYDWSATLSSLPGLLGFETAKAETA
jgi:sugar transferase (PEP-CTERM/EpsH1 system associated)